MNYKDMQKKCARTIKSKKGNAVYYHIPSLEKCGFKDISRLPYSIRILLESVLRNLDGFAITEKDLSSLANWSPSTAGKKEFAFKPGRVILQDFTGVPAIVDLAAMRDAMKKLGGDINKINPSAQCDLVIDHSIQVDQFGTKTAKAANMKLEFKRNRERYEFLKWGQNAFKNFSVVPPATGIVHQVNLEYLAQGVLSKKIGRETVVFPDSLVGTDSHTTMINGLSVLGWGVGGIEAEAVMLGEPIYMLIPEVVGFEITEKLNEGVTATDLVLTITQILRSKGVVGKFVEFYGDGLKELSLPDRATVANMAPEYGATMGFFPFDEETLDYYKLTARSSPQIDLIEKYMRAQGLFAGAKKESIEFSSVLKLDLSSVEPCVAGPKRPQDRIILKSVKKEFIETLLKPVAERGFGLAEKSLEKNTPKRDKLSHGSVVIAAITSCTNTSNPSVLIAAGLLAKKAALVGLKTKPFVKTSFAPGSMVVEEYLEHAGLMAYLEKLGFYLVGYGCTTCIGNSGPLAADITKKIVEENLIAAGVLSGNRNFEGRINPYVKANFLASPPLVVAYALAGNVYFDFNNEALGVDKNGKDIFLKDIWPQTSEIKRAISRSVTANAFSKRYKNIFTGPAAWQKIKVEKSARYKWKKSSTYIQSPPFFSNIEKLPRDIKTISNARVLLKLGDSVTTDHISPAGSIATNSPAGNYLVERKVKPDDFNSYGSRRGNDSVMTRGTFANIRIRNLLAPGTEGGVTIYHPDKTQMTVFDASLKYKETNTPLIVLAGKEYGTGSSRDWAAKGPALLGVKAVIAESYERIHRSNLIGMGVLPLQFKEGLSADMLRLKGDEYYDIHLTDTIEPGQEITVSVKTSTHGGTHETFTAIVRIDTPVEVDYYRNGGILQTVLLKLACKSE